MDRAIELSLEQEFNLKSFEAQVQQMSREQAQEVLIMMRKQMMLREAMYQEFLKQAWDLN